MLVHRKKKVFALFLTEKKKKNPQSADMMLSNATFVSEL